MKILIIVTKLNKLVLFQGSLEMLKIAPNPDAAHEICTVFAPDCKQPWHRVHYNSSSSGNRGYESPGIRSKPSGHYESSSRITPASANRTSNSSSAFSTYSLPHRESNLNTNISVYNGSAASSTFNVTLGRRENAIRENEYDYEEGNEEESDEDENGNFYTSPHERFTNVTYVLKPTMDTFVRNQTTVCINGLLYLLVHLMINKLIAVKNY